MFPLKIELEQQFYGEIVVYEVGYCIKWYLNNIEQKYYGNLTWKMMIDNFRVPCAQTNPYHLAHHIHIVTKIQKKSKLALDTINYSTIR